MVWVGGSGHRSGRPACCYRSGAGVLIVVAAVSVAGSAAIVGSVCEVWSVVVCVEVVGVPSGEATSRVDFP